jgi:hypothetical protein
MKRNGLRAKSWRQRSCGLVEGEDGAWQVDTVGRNNLQAPELRCYISRCTYIFKRSQENNEEKAELVPKWE